MISYREYPILVVDDEPDVVATIELNLEPEFSVHAAGSGDEALAILARDPIAVLVTDQRMPGMSGLELVARALEIRPAVVALVLTGYVEVDALDAAVDRGELHRYLLKPWDGRDLRMSLRIAVEKAHLLRENLRLRGENRRLAGELERLTRSARP
jgi:DNA-binding NtrC family response regulator